MGLLDDLKVAAKAKPRGAMDTILAALDDEERNALDVYVEMIKDQRSLPSNQRSCTAASLLTILNSNGYKIGKTALQDYIARENF